MSNKTGAGKTSHVVVFRVLDREYGASIDQVKEVVRLRRITPVPEASAYIEGVIVLRGKVIPVFNLRKKFGIGSGGFDKKSRTIIARLEGHLIGIIVDEVAGVIGVTESEVTAPDGSLQKAQYLTGLVNIDKRLILLVDMAKLLTDEEATGVRDVCRKVEVRRKT